MIFLAVATSKVITFPCPDSQVSTAREGMGWAKHTELMFQMCEKQAPGKI